MPPDRPDLAAISVLADAYALRILQAIEDRPLTAPEIVRRTGLPPAACYRRLRTLVEAGFAAAEGSVRSRNGKQARRYAALVSRLQVVFDGARLHVNYDLRDGRTREVVLQLPIENP